MLKKILNTIISLKFIFKPKYWLMNHRYSKEWDEKLNRLMNNHDFTPHSQYQCKLGDSVIWITNHPYASFLDATNRFNGGVEFRPSRLTIERANKKLKRNKKRWRTQQRHNEFISNLRVINAELQEIRNELDRLTINKSSIYNKENDFMDNKTVKKLKL